MRRLNDLIVAQWCVLVALLVGLPWLRSGYLLSYDMVWVPRLDLQRADLWGAGDALPRAVPSDAFVAGLGAVIDPQITQRVVLLGALVLAGLGAARLARSFGLGLTPTLAAATWAQWNPYVAERLVLGQWPLLLATACLPWLVVAVRDPRGVRWAALTLALAGTALTPATGLMGFGLLLVVGMRRSGVLRPAILAGCLNAPWIVAGSLATVNPPDPAGVAAFAARSEGYGGVLGTLVTFGGTWNAQVVPDSRGSGLAVVLAWVIVALMVLGVVQLWRSDAGGTAALVVAAVVAVVLASWGAVAPGSLRDVIDGFGPAAVLRDGARYLALAMPLAAVALGAGVAVVLRRVRSADLRTAPAVLLVLLPMATLPDLANGVDGRLTPVDYPRDWARAAAAVAESPAAGDVLVLPFSAYRAPAWNEGRPVLDPATRYFDRVTLTADTLSIGGSPVVGESRRLATLGGLLTTGAPASEFAAQGVGLVVLDTTAAPGPGGAQPVLLAGLRELTPADASLRVFEIDGTRAPDRSASFDPLSLAWGVAALVLAVTLLVLGSRLLGSVRAVGTAVVQRGRSHR